MLGAVLSDGFTSNVHVVVFPDGSVAVSVIVAVSPIADPEVSDWVMTTSPGLLPQLSATPVANPV